MDGIEWLDDEKEEETINTENPTTEHHVEVTQQDEEIKPSIWTLQEVLLFGYHPPKQLEQRDIEAIFTENKRYLIWIVICALLYIADLVTDIILSLFFLYHMMWPITIIISLIIIIPSLISNLTNSTSTWKTKEYQRWDLKYRILWWMQIPFYFLFNLEPLYQYYRNYKNLQNHITLCSGKDRLQEEELIKENEQFLADYSEGFSNVSRIRWLQATLHAIPQVTFYLILFDLDDVLSYVILFLTVSTSMVGICISCYEYTRAYYISRKYIIGKIFTMCFTLCTSLVIFFRIMIVMEMIGSMIIDYGELHYRRNAGWVRPTILLILVVGHWIYETVRWKLIGPAGFTRIMYTFYSGIYRTFVPDNSTFYRCIVTNILFALQALFHHIGSFFVTHIYHWSYFRNFMLINHVIVFFLVLTNITHIGLSWYFRKIKK